MDKICKIVERKFPCRNEIIKVLSELIGDSTESFPGAIYLNGHSGTGKTQIVKEFMRQTARQFRLRTVHLNCVECYTIRILLENILLELVAENSNDALPGRCDNLKTFVDELRRMSATMSNDTPFGAVIVLDNAERLRDMDANILPSLLRLQQLSGLNICVVLISQLPFEKYYCKTGLTEVVTIHCPQYTKTETLHILSTDFENTRRLIRCRLQKNKEDECFARKLQIVDRISPDFFSNYLNLFLSVFYKACRDLPELKVTARKSFAIYLEPVLDGSVDAADVSRLWRHIAGPLRVALAQVYMRFDSSTQEQIALNVQDTNSLLDQSVRKLALSLELPFYGKFLLIAAFLASHNSAKEDKRLFVKHHGKQRKRMQSVHAKAKVLEKMSTSIGPKSFSIDRLLAIFYAILDEKVGLTCNLLSQISTLVHLKLLNFVSGENNMDGSSTLQCTVSLEFVLYIGKVVGFNVRQYLCDFMY